MYRILVADDEHYITDSIYSLLMRQTQWELEVFRAYDGEAAWDLLIRFRMDLIISDICMPGLDGLTLSHKARAVWPDCQIIFLTGYRNFEHAYDALQLGHVHYLLKTSDYTQLLELVTQSLAAADAQREQFARQMRLEAQVNMAFSMLRNDMGMQLFKGKLPPKDVLDGLSFNIDLGKDVLLLFCQMPFEAGHQALANHAARLLLHSLHRLFAGHPVHWFYCELNDSLVCLFQPDAQVGDESAVKAVQSLLWENLSDIQALIAQETGHTPVMMQSRDPLPVAALSGLLQDMVRISGQPSVQGAILKIATQQAPLDTQGAIRYAVQHIYQHYAQDISLLVLADSVHMNATYFCRLFKKETGKTFVDFLNSVRIESACRLLRDTYMKISEIAIATGFETPKYFHVVFKRYVHVTPAQFRKNE